MSLYKSFIKTLILQLLLLSLCSARDTQFLDLDFVSKSGPLSIAFGSCFRIFDMKNHIFKTIQENDPHVWTWMGDAAYTDDTKMSGFKKDNSLSLEHIKMKFEETTNDPCKIILIIVLIDYKEFAKGRKIIGVWDDHDYGVNDGNKNFPKKDGVREIYLDFIGEPKETQRRKEKGTGIY